MNNQKMKANIKNKMSKIIKQIIKMNKIQMNKHNYNIRKRIHNYPKNYYK